MFLTAAGTQVRECPSAQLPSLFTWKTRVVIIWSVEDRFLRLTYLLGLMRCRILTFHAKWEKYAGMNLAHRFAENPGKSRRFNCLDVCLVVQSNLGERVEFVCTALGYSSQFSQDWSQSQQSTLPQDCIDNQPLLISLDLWKQYFKISR